MNMQGSELKPEINRKSLKDSFKALETTYFREIGTLYKIIHDKIYDIAAVVCGQYLIECCIQHSSSSFIAQYYIITSDYDTLDESYINLPPDIEDIYFDRIKADLQRSDIRSFFHNLQLKSDSYRQKLLQRLCYQDSSIRQLFQWLFRYSDQTFEKILKDLDKRGIRYTQNARYDRDYNVQTTPLIESVSTGYMDIVQYMISIGCNVNNVNQAGESALFVACENGCSDIVRVLLENKADVSQCDRHDDSPLLRMCKVGNVEIVRLLLEHKADVSQCDSLGASALLRACGGGHVEIVRLLLKNKAEVSQCDRFGQTTIVMGVSVRSC